MPSSRETPTKNVPRVKPDSLDAFLAERVRAEVTAQLAAALAALNGNPFKYTADRRPWWAPTRKAYLRGYSLGAKASIEGLRAVGKVRAMTEAASEAIASLRGASKPHAEEQVPADNVADALRDALGLRRVG